MNIFQHKVFGKNGARRKVAVACAAGLLFCLIAAGLSGCSSGDAQQDFVNPIPQAEVDLTPTGELVIYVPSIITIQTDIEHAIQLYKNIYKDVDVKVEVIGEGYFDYEAYKTRVNIELMAGAGPDVVIINDMFFSDIYKTLDIGSFLNLDAVIGQDANFNKADYYEAVLDAGRYKGGQYLVPWGYYLPSTAYLPEKLEAAGFDISKAADIVAFFEELAGSLPILNETAAYQYAIGTTGYIYYAISHAGIKLLDYEYGRVLPDEGLFKAFCEAFKPYWETDDQSGGTNLSSFDDLRSGKTLFAWNIYNPVSLTGMIGEAKKLGESVSLFAIPSADGGLNAWTSGGLAIRSASPNQLNAWNFIKVMLSEQVQLGASKEGHMSGFPVNRQAMRGIVDRYTTEDHWGADYKRWRLTSEEVKPIYDLMDSIAGCNMQNATDWRYFRDSMTPYFNGEKSYDECLDELKGKLTLYLSE